MLTVEKVNRRARRLTGNEDSSWPYIRSQLKRGEKAYGLYNFNDDIILTVVDKQSDLDELNRRVDSGWYTWLGYFAMYRDDYLNLKQR